MQQRPMLILAVVAVLLLVGAPSALADNGEIAYIRKLYRALGISYDANGDVCNYQGITCQVGRHVANQVSYKIDLNNAGISTTVVPDLDDGVSGLDIYEINLGSNRGIKAQLPNSWGRLEWLEKLALSGSSFYGAIPSAWNAKMSSLKSVDLSNNALCYSMPSWNFGNFPSLEEVSFARNQLRHFSDAFGTFSSSTRLQSVNLQSNNFCDCMPNTWTSALLRNAATAAKADAASATCNGKACAGGDQCNPNATNAAAIVPRSSVMAVLASLFVAVLLAF